MGQKTMSTLAYEVAVHEQAAPEHLGHVAVARQLPLQHPVDELLAAEHLRTWSGYKIGLQAQSASSMGTK